MTISQLPTAITPDDVKHAIAYERFFNAADAVQGAFEAGRLWSTDYDTDTLKELSPLPAYGSLEQLTFCVLVLRSGIKVVGINYGSVDPTQQSPEKARAMARKQAEDKVWEILGNDLRMRQEVERQEQWRRDHHSLWAGYTELDGLRFEYAIGHVEINSMGSRHLSVTVPAALALSSDEDQVRLVVYLERLMDQLGPRMAGVGYLQLKFTAAAEEQMRQRYPHAGAGAELQVRDFFLTANHSGAAYALHGWHQSKPIKAKDTPTAVAQEPITGSVATPNDKYQIDYTITLIDHQSHDLELRVPKEFNPTSVEEILDFFKALDNVCDRMPHTFHTSRKVTIKFLNARVDDWIIQVMNAQGSLFEFKDKMFEWHDKALRSIKYEFIGETTRIWARVTEGDGSDLPAVLVDESGERTPYRFTVGKVKTGMFSSTKEVQITLGDYYDFQSGKFNRHLPLVLKILVNHPLSEGTAGFRIDAAPAQLPAALPVFKKIEREGLHDFRVIVKDTYLQCFYSPDSSNQTPTLRYLPLAGA